MLPVSLRESFQFVVNPVVGSLFSARGAESGFTRMGDFLSVSAKTFEYVVAKKRCSANHKFKYINNDTCSDEISVFKKQFPPVSIIHEDISQSYCAAYIFHMFNILQNKKYSGKSGRLATLT